MKARYGANRRKRANLVFALANAIDNRELSDMDDSFGGYLARMAKREIQGETLQDAQARARVTQSTVNWNGHFVHCDGSMYAYNH